MTPQSEMFDDTRPFDLWAALAAEGNHILMEHLHKAEKGEPGYGTIVVTKAGFSEDDEVHNAVLDWLQEHKINICNPGNDIANL
jgi:hypothetical protein